MASELSEGSAQVMTMMMDHMFHESDNTINKAIEKIVDANGHFDGKYMICYSEAYKTEM